MGILDEFVADKEESSLVLAKAFPAKARDHFLQIRKKSGPW